MSPESQAHTALYPSSSLSTSDHPHPKYLIASEVLAILAVSNDTVLKRFAALDGVIDIGTPDGLLKRRKRVLRIPQRTLDRHIAEKQVRSALTHPTATSQSKKATRSGVASPP
jgi:hypothetical protein